ncbi:MAG: hypothetical protein TR69_WS6001001378 [candidate division WS6 bacterium OLB20]|uniref:Uncharacterized protein n=1 Tax=candidate division WS6 bacterium OLB20 TaxID=1617426 RepID=A0A136LWQ7_9BACT|nr:MAG: hypothetical protein TR69_WS6001001378 [candidate division WS6 bacterium OLB20]
MNTARSVFLAFSGSAAVLLMVMIAAFNVPQTRIPVNQDILGAQIQKPPQALFTLSVTGYETDTITYSELTGMSGTDQPGYVPLTGLLAEYLTSDAIITATSVTGTDYLINLSSTDSQGYTIMFDRNSASIILLEDGQPGDIPVVAQITSLTVDLLPSSE